MELYRATEPRNCIRTLAPTEVPNELATSFAPTPKARTKATINPSTTIHITSDGSSNMTAAIYSGAHDSDRIVMRSTMIQ